MNLLASSVSVDRGSRTNDMANNLLSARQARREETNILTKIIQGRNQTYKEPFLTIDPSHPDRGKKRFDPNFRPLRSKINIKINATEA